MATAKIKYTGDFKAECTHLDSGTTIMTAAPKDNMGDGSAFSPTDLCCTALGSCMVVSMAVFAKKNGIEFGEASAEVTKVMASEPRRISEVIVEIAMPKIVYTEDQKALLEGAGKNCPMSKSLGEGIIETVSFIY